jgi:ribonucleoside-diphosphate reductase beta chain
MTIDSNIFNINKTDYKNPSLFLGEKPGLFDSINKKYPEIWKLYKKMKALDWDENEFDFSTCNVEFKSCPKSVYEMMIRTLAWQWEADSMAAKNIAPIVAPFVTSSELWACWQRVSDNEVIHALTYSEIVRNSFDDPDEVLNDILKVSQSLQRMEAISEIFSKAYTTGHKLSLGLVEKNQETYNDIFMFVCAMYVLERIQFMASFAVTFLIVDSGMFQPIGSAVQKICQDELEIHAQLDKAILNYELNTGEGITAFNQCKDRIEKVIDDVIQTEFTWSDYLFSEGRELVAADASLLKQWVLYNAAEVYKFFGIKPKHILPTKNPIVSIDKWININTVQGSPQEARQGAYMVGAVVDTIGDKVIEIDL